MKLKLGIGTLCKSRLQISPYAFVVLLSWILALQSPVLVNAQKKGRASALLHTISKDPPLNYLKQGTFEKFEIGTTCTPSTADTLDDCNKATLSIGQLRNEKVIQSFLGIALRCDSVIKNCVCAENGTSEVKGLLTNRTVCLMKELKKGSECISDWECHQGRCIFETGRDEDRANGNSFIRRCSSSARLVVVTETAILIIATLAILKFSE